LGSTEQYNARAIGDPSSRSSRRPSAAFAAAKVGRDAEASVGHGGHHHGGLERGPEKKR